jgi:hypothetical protein
MMDDGWCKAKGYEKNLNEAATKVANQLEEALYCMVSVLHGAL